MLLFCASDAGGANELIPVMREATTRKIPFEVLSSPVTQPLFTNAKIDAEERALTSIEDAEQYLREHKIHALIIGTCGAVKSEHYLTAAARTMNIRSVCVLDEWFRFTIRFKDEDGAVGRYLPDIVCVQDELSMKLATEDGLPAEMLRVTGSPALAALAQRAKEFAANPPPVPPSLQKAGDRPSILFLSQPLKKGYGTKPGESGIFGAFIGYQEDIVREDLANIASGIDADLFILEKLHPSDDLKAAPPCNANVEWMVHKEPEPVWPLLWHADVVVGMSTKALMEAAILGIRGLSYQPHALDPNMCTAARFDLAELHTSKESLARTLPALLRNPKSAPTPPAFPFANPDAAAKILALAGE